MSLFILLKELNIVYPIPFSLIPIINCEILYLSSNLCDIEKKYMIFLTNITWIK